MNAEASQPRSAATLVNADGRVGREAVLAAAVDPEVTGLQAPRYLGLRRRRHGTTLAFRIIVPLALLFVWWLGTDIGFISTTVLASPIQVVRAAQQLIQTGQLWVYLEASLRREALGVGLGVAVGLTFGISSGLARLGEDLIDPMMQVLRAVPFLALVPLFISWFGVAEMFKVVLIAVATVGPMYAYTYTAVRNVDRKIIEAARGFGLHGARLVWEVVIPCTLPSLLMALRVSMGISLTGLIAAEQVGTTVGIGYLVSLAEEYFRNDYMVLCILLYAILGLLIDGVMRIVERVLMPWRRYQAVR